MAGEGARRRLVDGDPAGVRPGTRRVLGKILRPAARRRSAEPLRAVHDDDRRSRHPLPARPSPVEGATPCIMTHGWPGSVIEFTKVIDPLVDPVAHGGEASDALELGIPSLPGHGWSGKPTVTGWGPQEVAPAGTELVGRLPPA